MTPGTGFEADKVSGKARNATNKPRPYAGDHPSHTAENCAKFHYSCFPLGDSTEFSRFAREGGKIREGGRQKYGNVRDYFQRCGESGTLRRFVCLSGGVTQTGKGRTELATRESLSCPGRAVEVQALLCEKEV